MNKSLNYLYFLEKVSSLSHNLQKERELSILFLDSYGKSNIDDLIKQVNKSDESIDNLNNIRYFFYLTSLGGRNSLPSLRRSVY